MSVFDNFEILASVESRLTMVTAWGEWVLGTGDVLASLKMHSKGPTGQRGARRIEKCSYVRKRRKASTICNSRNFLAHVITRLRVASDTRFRHNRWTARLVRARFSCSTPPALYFLLPPHPEV